MILFILEKQASTELVDEFLEQARTEMRKSAPPGDDESVYVFRIIRSNDLQYMSLESSEDCDQPPISLEDNEFEGMSFDDLESWMLFRAKDSEDKAEAAGDEERREHRVDWSFWAMDAKDLRDKTCTAFDIRRGDNGRWLRKVVKVRVPWSYVWIVGANVDIANMDLHDCTKEGFDNIPSNGWCTFAPW